MLAFRFLLCFGTTQTVGRSKKVGSEPAPGSTRPTYRVPSVATPLAPPSLTRTSAPSLTAGGPSSARRRAPPGPSRRSGPSSRPVSSPPTTPRPPRPTSGTSRYVTYCAIFCPPIYPPTHLPILPARHPPTYLHTDQGPLRQRRVPRGHPGRDRVWY